MARMREIKFRAWDKRNKVMSFFGSFFSIEDMDSCGLIFHPKVSDDHKQGNAKDFKLMQFAGLKDKNGKEIFEGDILKRKESKVELKEGDIDFLGTDGLYIVEIKNQRFAYPINRPDAWSDIFEDDEIIGNIYENSELLND